MQGRPQTGPPIGVPGKESEGDCSGLVLTLLTAKSLLGAPACCANFLNGQTRGKDTRALLISPQAPVSAKSLLSPRAPLQVSEGQQLWRPESQDMETLRGTCMCTICRHLGLSLSGDDAGLYTMVPVRVWVLFKTFPFCFGNRHLS